MYIRSTKNGEETQRTHTHTHTKTVPFSTLVKVAHATWPGDQTFLSYDSRAHGLHGVFFLLNSIRRDGLIAIILYKLVYDIRIARCSIMRPSPPPPVGYRCLSVWTCLINGHVFVSSFKCFFFLYLIAAAAVAVTTDTTVSSHTHMYGKSTIRTFAGL